MNWYLKAMNQYADFTGRARRKEYWMFVLFNTIFALIAILLDYKIGPIVDDDGFFSIYLLYFMAALIPSLAVSVRRLHDVGRTGWWMRIAFIIIGAIWLFILMVSERENHANQYGPDPKSV